MSSVYNQDTQNTEYLKKKRDRELVEDNLKDKDSKKKKKTENKNKDGSNNEDIDNDTKEEVVDTNSELKELIVGKGVANALIVFKQRGVLGKCEFIGRYKDKDPVKEMEKFPKSKKKEIEIDYRDNKGNTIVFISFMQPLLNISLNFDLNIYREEYE